MNWTYKQSTGELHHGDQLVGVGYSGHAEGRNNPAMQAVHDVGPLPRGWYTIGPAHDTTTHGPHVICLTPDPSNEEDGRAGFLMHGDNAKHDASLGCIIMGPVIRNTVSASADKRLEVIA